MLRILSIKLLPELKHVYLGDNRAVKATAVGPVKLRGYSLDGVFYVPDLSCNLVSVSMLIKMGCTLQFLKEEARIELGSLNLVARAKRCFCGTPNGSTSIATIALTFGSPESPISLEAGIDWSNWY